MDKIPEKKASIRKRPVSGLCQANKRKKRLPAVCILGASALCIAAAAFFLLIRKASFSGNNPQKNDGRMKADLALLSEEEYDSALLSMHSTEYFSKEDFAFYNAENTFIASHAILDTHELAAYLDAILSSGNPVHSLYLCLDPELLWTRARQKPQKWESLLQENLLSYIQAHGDISFEILLPSPQIRYWLELEDEKLDTLLTVYHDFVIRLSACPNTMLFFPGYEYWLMVNPDNYSGTLFDTNQVITQKLFLLTFCDGVYQITPENEEYFWSSLRNTIQQEKNDPSEYPDLSDRCLVFFGDSVLANFPGSYSIPGYVQGLSGAVTYNYAVGGTSAAAGFPTALNSFLCDAADREDLRDDLEDKRLCFIINYGFNDYFSGVPVSNPSDPQDGDTYTGSLRNCISSLRTAYPHADILLMTPTHTSYFDNGRESMGQNGSPFPAYIKAAEDISAEMGLFFADNYNDFVITPENLGDYLADGCHPNERGRLAIAIRLMDFLSGL